MTKFGQLISASVIVILLGVGIYWLIGWKSASNPGGLPEFNYSQKNKKRCAWYKIRPAANDSVRRDGCSCLYFSKGRRENDRGLVRQGRSIISGKRVFRICRRAFKNIGKLEIPLNKARVTLTCAQAF